MRCLTKVIFINSANVPYAEIRLDGNVHFIGTQGVGKSTLLRAILFFYNGDKTKLGIPKEKKNFDDFYLPHSNSYIVYEVSHERGAFCVLVFRSQGRACFRFIDGVWESRLLIDEAGDVTSEYTVIRRRLGDRGMTRIVDKYEDYRNIIYGNHRATGKEFYNYAIMESPAYENIMRSLQNIFLNSRVDAEFIKEIILRSMSEEIPSVDLAYYRRQVSDFETEYNNISEWFRKDAKGQIPVRVKAQKVIADYKEMIFLQKTIEELYAELLYADRVARESLPRVEASEAKHQCELQRFERLIAEQKQKYDKEKEDIDKSLGEVESKLKDIRTKRKKYEQIQIDKVLSRVENEPNVRLNLDSFRKQKDALTREYDNLNEKYELLQNQLRNDFQAFEINCKSRISILAEQCLKLREGIMKSKQQRSDELRAAQEAALAAVNEHADDLKHQERNLETELLRLQYFRPLGEEIDASEERLREMKASEAVLRTQVKTYDLQIEQLMKDYEFQCSKLDSDCRSVIMGYEHEIDGLRNKIAAVDEILSSTSGSLYEWLDGKLPGWEKNIGKVIDQQRVLYRKGLKPRLVGGESFYGLELDLSELASEVRTPAQLREEKETLENAIIDLQHLIDENNTECEKAKETLSARMSPKVKELREKRNTDDMKLQALPGQMKALKIKIQSLEDRQNEMLGERKSKLNVKKQQIDALRLELKNEGKAVLEKMAKLLKENERLFEQKSKAAEAERDKAQDELLSSIAEKRSQCDMGIAELKAQRDSELKGAGVDVLALNKCENEIRKVLEEIRFIEDNREICSVYKNDKCELFDREDEFKDVRRALESKREKLSEKFGAHLRQLEEKLKKEKVSLEAVRADLQDIKDGFDQFDAFRNSEIFPSYLFEIKERTTLSKASSLLDEIKNCIMERLGMKDRFKRAVNDFKGHFKADNIFKFKINLIQDEDYMDFASDLEEFVEQDKIEDYRGRTSDRYMEILQRISREIGDLSGFCSQVEKIIKEINYDFREKNFVGAIRSIEIRSTDSGDRMVQLLRKIKEFTDEHSFEMGGLNLFTDESSRDDVNRKAVRYLEDLMASLNEFSERRSLLLSDIFQLQFRVVENDNDTGWVEKIANVGSDGTDILVKAMVNIMLINVFKEKVSRKFGEFRIHCMMDEIGKLHPNNVKGILDFANSRNILLINSSPTTYNVSDYRYTYLLSKDDAAKTIVQALISRREASLGY